MLSRSVGVEFFVLMSVCICCDAKGNGVSGVVLSFLGRLFILLLACI